MTRPVKHLYVVLGRDGMYDQVTLSLGKGARVPTSLAVRGHKYAFEPERAATLRYWYPWVRKTWFTPFVDILHPCVVKFSVNQEPADPLNSVVLAKPPLQRTVYSSLRIDTPALYQTWTHSPLKRNYRRRTKWGDSNIWKLIAVLLLAFMGAVALMLFTGGV